MSFLNIHIDLMNLRMLVEGIQEGTKTEPADRVCSRIIFYIRKYKHSPEVTVWQMETLLEYASFLFPLLISYKEGEFLDALLETQAADALNRTGLDAVLDTSFGALTAVEHAYLVFLEHYCQRLKAEKPGLSAYQAMMDRVVDTVSAIRHAEQVYSESIPTRDLLTDTFLSAQNGELKLSRREMQDLLSGKGRTSLTVLPNNETNRDVVSRQHIASAMIPEGLAFSCKMGVVDNIEVEIRPENEKYMLDQQIPFVTGEEKFIVDCPDNNSLFLLSYRDLTRLWPAIRYFIVMVYLLEGENEEEYRQRKDFCRAVDKEEALVPLPAPIP